MSTSNSAPPELFSATTILSLLATLAIVLTAYFASLRLLPAGTGPKIRTFYIWHLADSLTHLILEASFLYNCFFTYVPLPAHTADYPHPASSLSGPVLMGYTDRLYGSDYGSNPFAKLWQEYAKADHRWGGADLSIISLELLTVFLGGPIAFYISELVRGGAGTKAGKGSAKMWFWAIVLATGELYGGFMTFAPEWLSGNPSLDASNWMYMWLYLVFFNVLWVFFPFWVLYEAYSSISTAFTVAEMGATSRKVR